MNYHLIDNNIMVTLTNHLKNIRKIFFLTLFLICTNVLAEEERVTFDIPEQTLDSALSNFAEQADVQIMFGSHNKLSKKNVSLKGSYTPWDGLAILLVNTGFEYVQGDAGKSFAIRPIQLSGAGDNTDKSFVFTQHSSSSEDEGKQTLLTQANNVSDTSSGTEQHQRVFALEEIVVTAQKREQNVQGVAISLTVFSEKNIRDLQLTDPIDVAGQTPGLNIRYTDGNTNPIVNIRGIGLNDNNSNNNPSAAVHIDDVYISSSAYLSFPLFDLERIEVLKGPQGTLFGRNTSGGAVNFYTKKPTQEKEGYVSASLGNYETYRLEAAVSGALTENLSGRLAFITIQSEGHQTNIGTIEAGTAGQNAFVAPFPDNPTTERTSHGADDVTAARVTLDWNATETFNVMFSGHAMFDDSDNWIQRLTGPDNAGFVQLGDRNTVASEFSPGREAEGYGFVLKSTTDFETMELITITGFESYDRVSAIDVAGPSRYFTRDQDEELWQFTQEVRLQSSATDKIFWTVGGFYSDDEVDSSNGLVFGEPGRFSPTTLLTAYTQEGSSFAFFGHAEYQFAEQFKLIGGLRYTDEDKKYTGGSRDIDPFGLSPGGISALPPGGAGIQVSEKYSTSDLSGKIGLDWTPVDDILVYFSFSKGFKSGGFDGSTFTGTPLEATPFKEETVLSYELGFKSTIFDQRLRLNGAVFYYDYDDLQVSLRADFAPGLAGTTRVNAGAARIWGFELDTIAYLFEGLTLQGGLSYLDTRVNEVSDIVARASDITVGNEVPDAPEISLNVAGRYETALSDDVGFSAAIDASYKDDFFANINNSPVLSPDEYVLVNAKAALRYGDAWEFSIWARNLLDNDYVISRSLVTSSSGSPVETYGKPRVYGLTIRYLF
jgi:iron complex outermembrane recepter protein